MCWNRRIQMKGKMEAAYDCELLTAGMWHDSLGDIALQQVSQNLLTRRGFSVLITDTATGLVPAIIGPGAILTGEREGLWWNSLCNFHANGANILNAVSVASNGDFNFLSEYLYVSVRDFASCQRLQDFCDVEVVPCPTVLMPRPSLSFYVNLIGCKFLTKDNYYIIDRGIVPRNTSKDYMEINTRPWSGGGCPTFNHRNPNVLAAAIAKADYVYCSTLHLSIIAMAMGTPFLYYEPSDQKGTHYWRRADFEECIVRSKADLTEERLNSITDKFNVTRDEEQQAARRHIGRISRHLTEERSKCCH